MKTEKAALAITWLAAARANSFRNRDLLLPAQSFLQASATITFKTIKSKVYFKNGWNKLDFVGICLFIIGFAIHFVSEFTDECYKNNIFSGDRCHKDS